MPQMQRPFTQQPEENPVPECWNLGDLSWGAFTPLGQEILIMEKQPSLRSHPRPAREPYTGGN